MTNRIKEDAVNYVEIKIVLEEYQRALDLWTNEDSSVGQMKVLVKRQVFQKVAIASLLGLPKKYR